MRVATAEGIRSRLRLPDRNIGTQAIAREDFEGTVEGQLFGVVGRGCPPDDDATANFLHGQSPDSVVGRLPDSHLDLFGKGHHRHDSVALTSEAFSVLAKWS